MAAALIVSEQLQQVKDAYLTRCLLAGSSTLASINYNSLTDINKMGLIYSH